MTPCVTTKNCEDSCDHRGRHRGTDGTARPFHQVPRALEAVTTSNMTTTEGQQVEEKEPVDKKVVGGFAFA